MLAFQPGRIEKLSETVFQTGESLAPSIPLYMHIVQGSTASALIDAGLPQSRPSIESLIAHAEANGARLRYACNTHAHHDHIGNLRFVREKYGAAVVATARSRRWLEDPEQNLQEFAFHHPHLLGEPEQLRTELASTFDGSTQVDVLVDESITLNLGGGVELEAFRVDGHLHSELAWFESKSRFLILGDAVTGTSWPFFHGHVDPKGFRRSLHDLRSFVRDRRVETVAMSHYEPRDASAFLELLATVEEYLDEVYETVLAQFASDAVSLEQVWRGVCCAMGKERDFRSLGMVAAHLDELVGEGRLSLAGPELYVRISTSGR